MELYFPAYYHSFRCLAGACPDSCCKEWTVDVDAEAAKLYRSLPGELGDRLRSVLEDTGDGTVMTIEDGRCPMWRQDGLCRIHAELGHDALCRTCREFPRLRHDYGDFVELGLELSCPEAARLIFTAPSQGMLVQAHPGGDPPEYDLQTMDTLRRSRKDILAYLQTATCTVPELLAVILLFSHSIQVELDGGEPEPFCPEALLRSAQGFFGEGNPVAFLDFFRNLEVLTPRWHELLAHPQGGGEWSPQLPALARYLIQRYWFQAVSDFDLVCRGKLVVSACLLVHLLGGDVVQTAQTFSKEIENNPDNLEAILDGAYTSPALTDVNLLSLLSL